MEASLRIQSFINGIFYRLRKNRRWSRKNYREKPARQLKGLNLSQINKIEKLRSHYRVNFENFLDHGNSLENYHLLWLLDRVRRKTGWHPQGSHLVDVGSKNFYYAPTLNTFFTPLQMTGIELDAFGLYRNFHTRYSYAQYYIQSHPQAFFEANDFCRYNKRATLLTFFYPFVIPEPLVRWPLPFSEFKPQALFNHARSLLSQGSPLFMVNQGPEEWEAAQAYLERAGFKKIFNFTLENSLLHRSIPPEISLWE